MTRVVSAGGNKQHAGPAVNMSKLEQETEELKGILNATIYGCKLNSSNCGYFNFQSHRFRSSAKGSDPEGARNCTVPWSDPNFLQLVNEKIQVVQEYEHGKAVPSQQILGKLERALGIKLRGDNIGKPLEVGKRN